MDGTRGGHHSVGAVSRARYRFVATWNVCPGMRTSTVVRAAVTREIRPLVRRFGIAIGLGFLGPRGRADLDRAHGRTRVPFARTGGVRRPWLPAGPGSSPGRGVGSRVGPRKDRHRLSRDGCDRQATPHPPTGGDGRRDPLVEPLLKPTARLSFVDPPDRRRAIRGGTPGGEIGDRRRGPHRRRVRTTAGSTLRGRCRPDRGRVSGSPRI